MLNDDSSNNLHRAVYRHIQLKLPNTYTLLLSPIRGGCRKKKRGMEEYTHGTWKGGSEHGSNKSYISQNTRLCDELRVEGLKTLW